MAAEATREGLRVRDLTGGTFNCAGTLLAGFGVDAPDRRCNRRSQWVKWNRSKQHVALNVTTPADRTVGLRTAFGGATDDVLRDLPDTTADDIRRLGADRHRRRPHRVRSLVAKRTGHGRERRCAPRGHAIRRDVNPG